MLKITFYVPVDDAQKVKAAMFEAGAGKIGNYDCCSWEVLGKGQFRPLEGSKPHIGSQDKIEEIPELRVEMVCLEKDIQQIVAAMKHSHPYETPAFDVIKIVDF